MRTFVPAETLVYLETNDLAAALLPIVDAKPFKEVAKSQPDLSALKGVQLAVAVLGFEATEEKLTDEQSIGSVKPRFVAVADTHAWNSTAVAFAERKLGGFVADIYGSEPKLEKSDKHGGKYFAWTAEDKRKAYALVIDGIVYFANDETAIDKCIAVRRGEADSILKTEKIKPSDPGTLARGYVSTDGIAQISGVIGMKLASEASDESEIQSVVAGLLPQLIRKSITEISWTSAKTEKGIEDNYQFGVPPELANVLSETLAVGSDIDPTLFDHVSPDSSSVTLYNFKDPQIAWRGVLSVAQKDTTPIVGKILAELSASLFEPYGVTDIEKYLRGVGPAIVTVQWDSIETEPIAIAAIRSEADAKNSFPLSELTPSIGLSPNGDRRYSANDNSFSFSILKSGKMVNGNPARVAANTVANNNRSSFQTLISSKAAISTSGREKESADQIVELLTSGTKDNTKASSTYLTETRFTKSGMERRTVSDFGLIGQIIAQLADN